jgi:hypothetical protein
MPDYPVNLQVYIIRYFLQFYISGSKLCLFLMLPTVLSLLYLQLILHYSKLLYCGCWHSRATFYGHRRR